METKQRLEEKGKLQIFVLRFLERLGNPLYFKFLHRLPFTFCEFVSDSHLSVSISLVSRLVVGIDCFFLFFSFEVDRLVETKRLNLILFVVAEDRERILVA